mmetsp:Transcript_65923/g.157638  ORF Transcript_65923/g.157638 Transcript_65923/m.157638 type:complete len:288 (+) Transcript_65923:146-1009(+)
MQQGGWGAPHDQYAEGGWGGAAQDQYAGYAQPSAPPPPPPGHDLPPDVARAIEKAKPPTHEHTTTSMMIIVFGLLTFFIQAVALVMPYWRGNRYGIVMYPMPRYYGLFMVKGMTTQFHHVAAERACAAMGALRFLNGCVTPICLQYLEKCKMYNLMMYIGYTCGAVMAHATVIQLLCLYWVIMMTPRKLKWAITWWRVICLLNIASGVGFIVATEGIFDDLNTEAMYPIQDIYFCAFLGGFVILALLVMSYMAGNVRAEMLIHEKEALNVPGLGPCDDSSDEDKDKE